MREKIMNLSSSLVPVGVAILVAKARTIVVILYSCYTNWTPTKVIKEQTDFSSKGVPVGLHFLVVKDTIITAMQLKFPVKNNISKAIEVQPRLQEQL